MLHIAGYIYPAVLRLLPHRPHRCRRVWISDRSDSNANQGGLFCKLEKNCRPTIRTEKCLDGIALGRNTFVGLGLPFDADLIPVIIVQNAEGCPGSALAIQTVTGNCKQRALWQFQRQLPALAFSLHD